MPDQPALTRETSVVGVRERLNQRRAIAISIAGVIILGVVAFLFRDAFSTRPQERAAGQRAFFSIDDGNTWFPDDATKLPPFEREGKTAYRVRVYKCPHGKEFVSHLERYALGDKKRIEEAARASGGGAMVMEQTTFMQIGEVKKPGDTQWIRSSPQNLEQFSRTMQPKCPDGSTTGIQPVLPE
jgi:hypothetical protein